MSAATIHRRKNTVGVTLIELMVTLSVLGILAALAVPNVRFFLLKSTASGIATDFARDVGKARVEAISRNQCVTMCQSTTTNNATPTCVASGSNWNRGWILFVNPTCSATLNATDATGLRPVISVTQAGNTQFTLQHASGSALRRMMFDPKGMTTLGSAGRTMTLSYTPENVASPHYRSLCLSSAGRVIIKKYAGTSACS